MTIPELLAAARARLAERQNKKAKLRKQLAALNQRIATNKQKIKRLEAKATVRQAWHPGAIRNTYTDGGAYRRGDVPAKLVWHTTEGSSLPAYSGSAPHFTLNPQTGQLWQHIAINRCALSLKHPAGTAETNHAHAIQVEMIGFASQTQNWSDAAYQRVAALARWIEFNGDVERRCNVTFTGPPGNRLSGDAWLRYSGHIGHQHVPGNDHWDPGRLRIEKIL